MTATVTATRITEDEYRILTRFAAGQTLRQIAGQTGAAVADIRSLVWDVAENNQARAKELIAEYEKANLSATDEPTQEQNAPAEKSVQVLHGPEDIADLLNAAVATGDSELAGHADRISSLIGDLRLMLHEQTMRAEARAALVDEAARLEARLAEIRTQLDTLGGGAA